MGMWDWLENQYPAPDSRFGTNGVPRLGASDASALLKLIERGVAARDQTDDDYADAAQSAPQAVAAIMARAVKPPYGRDEGALTQVPEDWTRRMLRGPYSGYPAWPSPANPASPFSPPLLPAALVNAPIDDVNAGGAQAAREAAARTVANAARHPYGRVFESVVPNNAPPVAADNAPNENDHARAAQAARESGAMSTAYAVRPFHGRQEGALTQFQEDAVIPKTPLDFALLMAGWPFARSAKVGALALGALLDSATEAEAGPLSKLIKGGTKAGSRLSMDLASRLERARQMGFHTDLPLAHGTHVEHLGFNGGRVKCPDCRRLPQRGPRGRRH